jgi:hypothetical protein
VAIAVPVFLAMPVSVALTVGAPVSGVSIGVVAVGMGRVGGRGLSVFSGKDLREAACGSAVTL